MDETLTAADLTVGSTVDLLDGGSCLGPHTVASLPESHWDDHTCVVFTDGCSMYAVPLDATFARA